MADGDFAPRRPDPLGAADALAAMRASRAKVLQGACPPWRHALLAGLMSGVVAAQAAPAKVFFAVMGVVFVGLIAFALVWRARKGVFVNGWRAGATRRVSLAILTAYMTVYTITWWLRTERGLWVAPLVGAAVLFPVLWTLSRRWNTAFRADLAA